jgi:hypothetical protein
LRRSFLFLNHFDRAEFAFHRTDTTAFTEPEVNVDFLSKFFNAGVGAEQVTPVTPLAKV